MMGGLFIPRRIVLVLLCLPLSLSEPSEAWERRGGSKGQSLACPLFVCSEARRGGGVRRGEMTVFLR